MTKMEQIFIKELKGNFNLRRPKSTKPTPIYYVVYMDGIQHYLGHLHNHVGLTENFDQSENEEFLVNDSP